MTDIQINRRAPVWPAFGDFARRILHRFRRRADALATGHPDARQPVTRRPDCADYNEAFILQHWASYDPWR